MNRPTFALLGAAPAFAEALPVGQLYFPSWERYKAAFRGIFERQYYTEYGPLCGQLEERLQAFLGVRHAICVTNATIGLMMVADALSLKGKVILPGFTFIASANALSWAGLTPVFCDADAGTHQISPSHLASLVDRNVSAIMGVHLWGGACDIPALEDIAALHGIPLFFDAAHAFGCSVGGRTVAGFGQAEVFSFHATKILSAAEGGCICTDDDALADRLRTMRSSGGATQPVPVARTVNGRMSEAQAAIALMSLEDYPSNQRHNASLHQTYAAQLASIPGLRLISPSGVTSSNYQYLVCQIDAQAFGLSRDDIIRLLQAENVVARRYFHPGVHRSLPYAQTGQHLPVTDHLCATCFQLPIGALVDAESVERICDILRRAQHAAADISAAIERLPPVGPA